MKKTAVVLLSGGIDSTTCLAKAIEVHGVINVLALSLYYGQKHDKELFSARKVAEYYNVTHIEQEVSGAFDFSDCTLLRGNGKISHKSYGDQKKKIIDTYVPFRNALFLSYATAIAISVGAKYVYYGAHADDVAHNAYPDCSIKFVRHMGAAIEEGSGKQVRLCAPFVSWNKKQVIEYGLTLNAPYHLTWSCYEGGEKPCGKCGTCIDRINAFAQLGIEDPALKGE